MLRRHFLSVAGAAALGGKAFAASKVVIGVQGYSFRDRSLDEAIAAARQLNLTCYEIFEGHLEPRGMKRPELREWRTKVTDAYYKDIRKKFDDAGIQIWSIGCNFKPDFTDAEMEHGFTMARALGAKRINASTNLSIVDRIDSFAKKFDIYVGLHNHSNMKPNEVATPDNFAEGMKGRSKYIGVHFDIGHFTAAGFDPVDYLAKNHEHIFTLHLKDRKKDQGPNVAFGEGDTPIKEVLQLLKKKGWNIPALIEYEYKGGDTIEEVRRARDYCLKAIA